MTIKYKSMKIKTHLIKNNETQIEINANHTNLIKSHTSNKISALNPFVVTAMSLLQKSTDSGVSGLNLARGSHRKTKGKP